jgi:DNA-binding XRE family transcriptional regulator
LVITTQIFLYPAETSGEPIKKCRLEQGLSQSDLAKLIGVDEMTIVNWEKGRNRPSKKLFGEIKCSVESLKGLVLCLRGI